LKKSLTRLEVKINRIEDVFAGDLEQGKIVDKPLIEDNERLDCIYDNLPSGFEKFISHQ